MSKVELELPARATSPRAARQAVSGLLRDEGISGVPYDDALLIVSELVTNAVRHAQSDIELVATFDRGELCVRVSDNESALPRTGLPTPGQAGGWGMFLVAEMCSEWGCELHTSANGKTVWATLPIGIPLD